MTPRAWTSVYVPIRPPRICSGAAYAGVNRRRPRARPIGTRLESVELLGDPEVEQLHDAVGRHENVRRLEIAVNDEMAVRMLHRLADIAKETQRPTIDVAWVPPVRPADATYRSSRGCRWPWCRAD